METCTVPTTDPENLVLGFGPHEDKEGACFLEAASVVAGEEWSDTPECVSPVVAAFGRTLNDLLTDDSRQRLVPYVKLVVGTSDGWEGELRRRWVITDWLARTYAPLWLRAALWKKSADDLAALPEVRGPADWPEVWAVLLRVRDTMPDYAEMQEVFAGVPAGGSMKAVENGLWAGVWDESWKKFWGETDPDSLPTGVWGRAMEEAKALGPKCLRYLARLGGVVIPENSTMVHDHLGQKVPRFRSNTVRLAHCDQELQDRVKRVMAAEVDAAFALLDRLIAPAPLSPAPGDVRPA